nr:UvrB/UvrC motif-containing protein [Candidatus Parabeggiatoa sp.]
MLSIADKKAEYAVLSPDKLDKKIKQLQKQMYQHAENLEFEAAAKLRDEIQQLQANRLEMF